MSTTNEQLKQQLIQLRELNHLNQRKQQLTQIKQLTQLQQVQQQFLTGHFPKASSLKKTAMLMTDGMEQHRQAGADDSR